MADALTEFAWPVAANYHCIEVAEGAEDASRSPVDFHQWREKGRRAVLIQADGPVVGSVRPFTPEHALLYREFAELEITPESAVSFARRYGVLGDTGVDAVRPLHVQIPDFFPNGEALDGEVIDARYTDSWRRRGTTLRAAIHLHAHLRSSKPQQLAAWTTTHEWKWLAGRYENKHWNQWRGKPLLEVARQILIDVLEESLRDTAGPRVVWSSRLEKFRLSYTPRTLLGALWVQFALAVTDERTIRKCKFCDRPFEVSKEPTGSRARGDAEFCSDKCKSAEYRDRKSRAKKLRLSGKTLREIAVAVNTELPTVKAWLLASTKTEER